MDNWGRRLRRSLAFSMCLWMVGLLTACSSGPESGNAMGACATYWVSPLGDDQGGDGSSARPFRTLGKAKLAVRADPARGVCPISVNLRSGVYRLTEPLRFDALDSGGPAAEISYQAAPGNDGPVVLSGGLVVGNFKCGSESCEAVVDQLPADVLPRQLYVDDRRAIRARSNYASTAEGYALGIDPVYKIAARGLEPVAATLPLTNPQLVEAVTTEQWKMMRCPVDHVEAGTLVMKEPCWKNSNTFPEPWAFNQLSWLENAPEFLTHADMWYLDPYRKLLTYKPLQSRPPAQAVLPILELLVELAGSEQAPVSHLRFAGLEFSHAGWHGPNAASGYVADQSGNRLIGDQYSLNAYGHQRITYPTPGNVSLRYARNVTFSGNSFKHLGAVALVLERGSQNVLVDGNRFNDIASSAIRIGGIGDEDMRAGATSVVTGNTVRRNVVEYTGQDYWDSAGIYIGFASHTLVENNTIRHTPWSALAIGWGWGLLDDTGFPGLPHVTPYKWGTYATRTVMSHNRILGNRFSYFLERLWDGGAIYTNGAQGQNYESGLLIQANVAEYKRPNAGGNIYYTDGGSRYVTLAQNVSIYNPVGTTDFGPCAYPSSFSTLCVLTGLLPYGQDMGGCLPYGDIRFLGNYFGSPNIFYEICHNRYDPPTPDLVISNIGITSPSQVPRDLLDGAGAN